MKNKHGAGSNAQAPLVIEDEDAKASQNPIKRPRSSGIVIQRWFELREEIICRERKS